MVAAVAPAAPGIHAAFTLRRAMPHLGRPFQIRQGFGHAALGKLGAQIETRQGKPGHRQTLLAGPRQPAHGAFEIDRAALGARALAIVIEAAASGERDVPDYLDVDHNKMVVKFARIPALTDVPYPVHMEPNLVVEFYSR